MSLLTQWQVQGDSESYSESEGVLVHVIPPGISLLLYGCYLPLSVACMLIVYRRKRKTYKTQLGAMLLLALASTASVIIQCVNQGRALLALWGSEAALCYDLGGAASIMISKIVQDNMKTALIYDYAVLGIYIFSNVLADALLLYRCYIIWEKDLRVVFLPLLGYLCNIVFGILGLTYNTKLVFEFWILAVVENVVLAALITGKIWYIKREAGGALGPAVKINYNTIAAIILESGFVYSAIVLATAITAMMPRNAIYASSLLAAATQAVGIAPCLIIIRVALGVDTRDVFSSIAVLSNNHTLAISSRRRTEQDLSDSENNILDSEVALLGTEMRENSDPGEEGSDEPRLRVRVRNQLPSQTDDEGKYIAIANHAGDEENSDSNTQRTISNSAYDYEDTPIPELTPNAQQVEFARLDSAVLGWDGVLKVIHSNTPEET